MTKTEIDKMAAEPLCALFESLRRSPRRAAVQVFGELIHSRGHRVRALRQFCGYRLTAMRCAETGDHEGYNFRMGIARPLLDRAFPVGEGAKND